MMNNEKKISIIIPCFNEEGNIEKLVSRIDLALRQKNIIYEAIFIDDNSTDNTPQIISKLSANFPIYLFQKKGKRGKAQSLIEGFTSAKYPLICMIDADLQYPPEAIPEMVEKVDEGYDVVVAERKKRETSFSRKLASYVFRNIFGKKMNGLDVDVQSGLKVFKKEILERITLNPLPWSFDLEFLSQARDGSYKIGSIEILFEERHSGKTKVKLLSTTLQLAYTATKTKLKGPSAIPFSKNMVEKEGVGFHYKGEKFIHHTLLPYEESAFRRISPGQILVIISILEIIIWGFIFNWHAALVVSLAVLTILYFADLIFNFRLIIRSFSNSPEINVTKKELATLQEENLPMYTIFCPLYKEGKVLSQFTKAIANLDYPKDKLQVMLLLEEDDDETVGIAQALNLPPYFEIVVVPHSKPKTKPKACNFGLTRAKGKYIVIYDAEDVPEKDQLKKVILAFNKLGPETACIQAKLNFYNPHQNILTRVFTAEYSLWFDLVLTGLQSIDAPIPLGGTSNHFRLEDLITLNGWDSFNVTEDCDLGMRIVKRKYKTALVNSTTLEEANSDIRNWFWQRTRWIKGYIQTYFVHMRRPEEFVSELKKPHILTFQMVVGGKILSMFVNPLMWAITIAYFAGRAVVGPFIESLFPVAILYMAVISLVAGNFLYMYYYMIGCAKRKQWTLIKFAYLVPFYWLCMSMAAWVALYKFVVDPHHWSKTKHGLHLNNTNIILDAETEVGSDLTATAFVHS